jgi:N-carbamoylputrescine amidase
VIRTIALITGVYHDEGGPSRLRRRLAAARESGAELAVLPELPLDPWIAAAPRPRDQDAEPPEGPRHRALANVAAAAGVSLLGGAVVLDPETGRRASTALLFGTDGGLLQRYRKVHIPNEEGFWEAAHYEPGRDPPEPIQVDGLTVGIQVCSDVQRLTGAQILAARGAEVILVPRATPPESWERWKLTLRAVAVAAAAYLISVNRPPEPDSPVGGPSVAIGPRGEVLVETDEETALAQIDPEAVRAARADYPGYLSFAPEVMAMGWAGLSKPGRR